MICWLVGRKATVRVVAIDNVIVDAAPLVRRFIGQPLPNLLRWFEATFGPYIAERNW